MKNFDIDAIQNGTVYDQDGDKVGSVGQVYLDDASGQPNWVTVNTGLFGTKETFVPLDRATVEGDDIRVPYTKDMIKDAPNIDSDGHIDEGQEAELYRYYQLEGGAGYAGTGRDDRGADHGADRGAGDMGADGGADGGADTGRRAADLEDGDSVVRREEELHVGTERVETGRVRLRKHVVQDTKTVQVPVEREEVEVVREPISDGNRGGDLAEGETEVRLTEERPVVEKEVVDKERVGLDKHTVTENRDVQAEVGREEVEVVRDGDHDVDRSGWTDADYEREGYTRDNDGNWLDKLGNKLDRDNDGRIGR